MNKRILSASIILLAVVGLVSVSQSSRPTIAYSKPEIKDIHVNSQIIPKYDLTALHMQAEEILDQLTPTQLCDYPVEEEFLLWFYSKYGSAIWEKLIVESARTPENDDLWYQLTGSSMHVLWTSYSINYGLCNDEIANVYFKEGFESTDIVMDFAGDVNLDRDLENTKYMETVGKGLTPCLGPYLLQEVKGADIFMINHEYTYGEGGTPLPGKAFTFQAEPNNCQYLHDWGVDIVSLANNHSYDYGEEGLLMTLQTLREANIPVVGAGENLDEASAVKYFIINGRKIAIVSATQIERTLNYTQEATATSAGVLKTLNPAKFDAVIEEANQYADQVIVYVHWGTEGCLAYGSDQTQLAQSYIDHGADVVIGAHTHCLEGAQFYKNKLIFYSLGNFWFDWETPYADEGGLLQLEFNEAGEMKAKFLPTIYKDGVSYLITNEQIRQVKWNILEKYSTGIEIDKDGFIEEIHD